MFLLDECHRLSLPSRRLAALAAVACMAAGWAWSGPGLSALKPTRPVEIEFLNGSVKTGRLVGATAETVRPVSTTQRQRTLSEIRLLLDGKVPEVPAEEVRRIVLQPVERKVIHTDSSVSTLFLGSGPSKRPEPAGWYLPGAGVAGWEPAVLQRPSTAWRYIARSTWIWAKRDRHHGRNETVLFRHEFDLPEAERIVNARLEVSADDHIESFFINGRPVNLPTRSLLGEILRWDVTYLLQGGENVVAARVTNQQSKQHLNYAGFCYRIVCDLASGLKDVEPPAPGCFLLLTNGDRLSADLQHISSKEWTIRHAGRFVSIDPDWIELALMNYGNTIVRKGGLRHASLDTWLMPWKLVREAQNRRPPISLGPQSTVSWSYDLEPLERRQGLLARNGDWIEGRIEGVRSNRILVKPRYGETFGVAVDRVSLLQPNVPNPELQFQFRPTDFLSIVRLRLLNDDRVTGALDSLTPTAITIRPLFSKSMNLDLDEVIDIEFIMNMASRHRKRLTPGWPESVRRQIAAIGAPDRSDRNRIDATSLAVHRSLWNLGLDIDLRRLDAKEITDAGFLTPERFPVLLNLDQNELYFHSVRTNGDGYEAIRKYVRDGGTLVHFARGVPFWRGYVPHSGRWQVRLPTRNLNKELMMHIVTPGSRSRKAKPFHLPSNQGQHMYFALNRLSPFAEDLPQNVDLPMNEDMRFRPITDDYVTTPAVFFPVYRLTDSTGTDYGVAMALIRYGDRKDRPNYGVYVSHLLAEASFRGTSMIDYLLPKLLEIAVGAESPTVSAATMAIGAERIPDRPARASLESLENQVDRTAPPPKAPPAP